MLMDVSIGDFPSWYDMQNIFYAWVQSSNSIVDMTYGIGFGDKDWTFNFHESDDGIWYIDFYHITTEIYASLPMWKPDITIEEIMNYRRHYNEFEEDFRNKVDW